MVPRPYARGIGRGADGPRSSIEHRAVGRVATRPAVTPDAALEPLALRHTHDVHELAGRKHLDGQRLASLIALELLGLLEPDLADHAHRRHVRLLEMPGLGLRHVLLLRTEADLKRVVP